jgi:hypothetical protein
LERLAVETGKTQQDLAAEGINLLFKQYRKPEIAI